MKALKIFSLCVLLLLSSCFLRKKDFSISQFFLSKGFCKKAQISFQRIKNKTKKHKEFAYVAARDCLKKHKDGKSSLLFYESLLNEELQKGSFLNFKEKKDIEAKLARLSFYELKDYRKAIKYYKEILKFVPSPKEKTLNQYQIAESFFLLTKYDQSLQEIEKILKETIGLQNKKPAMILKGRNLIAKKNFDKALSFFVELAIKYPKEKNSFSEHSALIYEEKKDFLAAIKEIEKIDPPTPFARKKIQYLYERLKNQPGVRL